MIASGNHLLTQVKDNQPSLRRRLELGVSGSQAERVRQDRDRGPQSLGDPRIDGVSRQGLVSRYALGKADQDRASVGTNGLQARPGDWTLRANDRGRLLDLLGSNPRRWNEWIRAHWRIENGSHYVRDTAFAEDASRIRNNPDIAARLRSFAYNLIGAAGGSNTETLAGAPPSISTSSSNCRASIEN